MKCISNYVSSTSGQEELVFFHDQPSVSDLGGAYTIEIEPSPAEYYTEQATQHHVLTYETLQQPSQHQQVIIQQQQLQVQAFFFYIIN